MNAAHEWVAIQHVPYESPGSIASGAREAGVRLRTCHPYRGDALPDPEQLGGLVVMGGPMGVSETASHPYLAAELKLIGALLEAERPVLGVCLGAQLLASALGANVYPGEITEIGPGTVELTAEGCEDPVLGLSSGRRQAGAARADRELPVVHWHEETFDLPAGAVRLARSRPYPNQAFRFGRCAYGLQFHVEVDQELVAGWQAHLPDGVEIGEQARAAVERTGRAAIAAFFDLAARER